MGASIEDIKAGLTDLSGNDAKYKGKTTQLHATGFNTLVSDLNVVHSPAERVLIAQQT